jgi:hypothetical protein
MADFCLYEIDQLLQDTINACLAKAEQAEGEISEDWDEFLEAVRMERDQKALGVARYIKNLLAESEAVKSEKMALAKRQAALEGRTESLKRYLSNHIKAGEKISDANTVLSWRKSTVFNILDESKVPETYFKIEKTPMKVEIKDAIKNGAVVPGVELVEKHSIQIK